MGLILGFLIMAACFIVLMTPVVMACLELIPFLVGYLIKLLTGRHPSWLNFYLTQRLIKWEIN